MAEKIALQGFSRLRFFPISDNNTEEYAVDTGSSFHVPWVQDMTRENDTSEAAIYADDTLYLNVKNWNGIRSTITVAELTLEMMGLLGFGDYNETTRSLEWNPQGRNLEFGVTFRCLQTNGNYRMMRMYSFKIDEVRETSIRTRGDNVAINAYQLIGTFANRVVDGRPGEIHDGDNMEWLDDIPAVKAV
ncbi:MAG: hypothetical protein FWE20_10890 [Defluviitaleaceae bacterium]|nr:hypothetical protein [Defluviitaleaceae bacterium]